MLRAGDDRAFKSLARMYCVEFARKHIPVIDADNSWRIYSVTAQFLFVYKSSYPNTAVNY